MNALDDINPDEYNPIHGFVVYFDFIPTLPKNIRQVENIFIGFKGAKQVTESYTTNKVSTEPLGPKSGQNKAIYNKRMLVKKIPHDNQSKLVIELHAIDNSQANGAIAIGWTWLMMFNNMDD
jgi:hypothetical protein